MAKATKQQQLATVVAQPQDQTVAQVSETAEIATGDHAVTKTSVRPAYQTYLEARKGLAQAFRGRERQDQEACREAERRYQLCGDAIEKAMKLREKAELIALDAYREAVKVAVEQASVAYNESIKQARLECQQRIADAWRSSTETSIHMAGVFGEDDIFRTNGQPHEDSQQDGLRLGARIRRWKNSLLSAVR